MAPRTTEDYWSAFILQRDAIKVSAQAFDGGSHGEAVRMAVSAFVLVGRGLRRHISLLDHLKIQDHTEFATTVPDGSVSGSPLISALVISMKTAFKVQLKPRGFAALMTGRRLKFDDWWNQIVLRSENGMSLNRGQIIRFMRDKDGGAHYDEEINDPTYEAAQRGELTGFSVEDHNGAVTPVLYGLEVTMRQIAEELLLTLDCIDPMHGFGYFVTANRENVGSINFKTP